MLNDKTVDACLKIGLHAVTDSRYRDDSLSHLLRTATEKEHLEDDTTRRGSLDIG